MVKWHKGFLNFFEVTNEEVVNNLIALVIFLLESTSLSPSQRQLIGGFRFRLNFVYYHV